MSKKKEASGPRLSSVIFVGILSFILGKVLAIGSLVSMPVSIMAKVPDPETVKPGTVWYVRGERAGRTAWQAKEEAWKAGTVDRLSLSEAELNQWSQDRLKQAKPVPGEEEAASWTDRLKVSVTPVNFHIIDGKLQLMTEVSLEGLLPEKSFIYAVTGHFENTSSGVNFVPDTGTLGTAPLGSIPYCRDWLFDLVRKQFESSDDVVWLDENFASLESVDIADGQMVLRRKAQG